MNKKVVLFGLIMLFFLSFVLAQEVCEEGDDDCKVDNAYACLNEKIDDKTCSGLSPEEKIFSFLATETSRYFLLCFYHSNILLPLVISKWYCEVIHKCQGFFFKTLEGYKVPRFITICNCWHFAKCMAWKLGDFGGVVRK